MSTDPQASPQANLGEPPQAEPAPSPAQTAAEAAAAAVQAATEAQLEADLGKARDDLLRALAEIENTRRRGERAVADARTFAIDKFARDILPVADTLGRALAAAPPRDNVDDATRTLLAGIEMTERNLLDVLARHGVKAFGAKGETFDPHLHQAVAQAPSDAPAGAIAEVMQPGYTLGERTLRPAMVLVSAGPPTAPPPSGETHVDIKV